MGVILKFIIFLLGLLFFLSIILGAKTVGYLLRFLFRPRSSARKKPYQSEKPTHRSEPETQEDRIISYQKKNFESSLAEDADFEEIKENES